MSVIKRETFRHTALSFLATYYKTRRFIPERLSNNRVQIINFHGLLKSEERQFRGLLDSLLRYHRFISYSEAVRRIQEGNIDQPYLSITFDDGLKSCVHGAEILNEYGISGCFFLCPSIIGETDNTKIDEFCRERLLIPRTDFLSWRDIEHMQKKGHEFGSHTMTHPNISNLTPHDAQDEIASSFKVLNERISNVRHFAWPLGRFFHFNRQSADEVFNIGFESCASGERGCHISDGKPLEKSDVCIRRDHVVALWPIDHVLYFLAKNSTHASLVNNLWPINYK